MKQITLTPEECAAIEKACGPAIDKIKDDLDRDLNNVRGTAAILTSMSTDLGKEWNIASEEEKSKALGEIGAFYKEEAEKKIGIYQGVIEKVKA